MMVGEEGACWVGIGRGERGESCRIDKVGNRNLNTIHIHGHVHI